MRASISYTDLKSGFRKGIYVVPGYYMKFWRECILDVFDKHTIWNHGKLKQFRELLFGAVFAAAYSKNKHENTYH